MGKYYNYNCIKWLRDDWKCTVVRAAMGIESGGYLNNPASEKAKIVTVIEACIDLGIYVIVDWHDHNAHEHQAQAIAFFQEIATDYGTYPNLIYEVFNEPEQDNWKTVLKPYLNAVVDSIRAIDPDNLIVVGTPTWSQDVDVASLNPLAQNNIAYALHFYAAYPYHKQTLRNKASTALNNGIALFVTEFGTVLNTGDGPIDAISNAIWSVIGPSLQLVEYSLKAITGGTNALADVSIKLADQKGNIFAARAVNEDVIKASAMGIVKGINKALSSKQKIHPHTV